MEITTPASVYSAGRAWPRNGDPSFGAWYVGWDYSAGVVPDCGQANLPQSLVRMWDIPRIAWENKNAMAPDEYTALTHRVLRPRNDVASATWMDGPVHPKYWTSEPGTTNH